MHTSEQKESDIKDITDISLNKSIPIKDMSVSIPASVVATPVASSATSDLANASSNATAAAMNANRLNNSNIKQEISKGQVMKNNQQQNQLKPNQQTNNKNQQQIQNKNKVNPKNKNFNQNNQQNGNSKPHNDGNQVQKKHHQNGQFKQQQFQGMNSQPQQEKKFTGRCRLFVGNLPSDMTDAEFKELFTKFGEIGETFLNQQRSFGFIKLDTRLNAEHAKQDLDGVMCKGRCLRVRFATHGAAIRIKHLSPFVSNEYLEQAFSQFGPVERAIVIVDEKGRPTGDGIVEFERKPSAVQCINRCSENCFILTSYPRPIVVEPLEQKDEEDGLPEKSMAKNAQYYSERETSPHFAHHGSFEQEIARKWIEFYDLEKQINEEAKQRIEQAKEILEYDIEQRLIDQQTIKIKEDLQRKQEELQRIEEMRKTEVQRRKDYEFRRNDDMGNGGMSKQQQHASSFSMHSNNNRLNQQQATHGGFDQSAMLNQPLSQSISQSQSANNNNSGSNRRFDHQQQANQIAMATQLNSTQQQHQHQQALLAAQLSAFAMAAAAQGNMNMSSALYSDNNTGNQSASMKNNPRESDYNRSNMNNDKRNNNNNKRANNNGNQGPRNNNRSDPSPKPAYDSKRARY